MSVPGLETAVLTLLVVQEKEGPVVSVVDFRDPDGAVQGSAEVVFMVERHGIDERLVRVESVIRQIFPNAAVSLLVPDLEATVIMPPWTWPYSAAKLLVCRENSCTISTGGGVPPQRWSWWYPGHRPARAWYCPFRR